MIEVKILMRDEVNAQLQELGVEVENDESDANWEVCFVNELRVNYTYKRIGRGYFISLGDEDFIITDKDGFDKVINSLK